MAQIRACFNGSGTLYCIRTNVFKEPYVDLATRATLTTLDSISSAMNWAYLVFSIAVAGFLIELFLRFKRESARAQTEQNAVRRDIEKLRSKVEAMRTKIANSKNSTENLKLEKNQLDEDIKGNKLKVEELESRHERRNVGRHRLD